MQWWHLFINQSEWKKKEEKKSSSVWVAISDIQKFFITGSLNLHFLAWLSNEMKLMWFCCLFTSPLPPSTPNSHVFKPVGQFQPNLAERQEKNILAASPSLMKISTGLRRDTGKNTLVLGNTSQVLHYMFSSWANQAAHTLPPACLCPGDLRFPTACVCCLLAVGVLMDSWWDMYDR